jgi:hypothetical protein
MRIRRDNLEKAKSDFILYCLFLSDYRDLDNRKILLFIKHICFINYTQFLAWIWD